MKEIKKCLPKKLKVKNATWWYIYVDMDDGTVTNMYDSGAYMTDSEINYGDNIVYFMAMLLFLGVDVLSTSMDDDGTKYFHSIRTEKLVYSVKGQIISDSHQLEKELVNYYKFFPKV